jgi:hypothetical protein
MTGYQSKKDMAQDKLAQTAQEHVATVQCIHGITIGYLEIMQPVGTKLYTAPPQRTWVDLTDEQIDVIYEQHHNQYGECESPNFGYERAIEAKSKELNT